MPTKNKKKDVFSHLPLDEMMEKSGFKKMPKRNNSSFLPDRTLIALMIAPTSAGKTHTLLELILGGHLDFTRLYWYSLTMTQDKVKFLKMHIQEAEKKTGKKIGTWIESNKEMIKPEDLDKREKNLMIFDDVVNQPQEKIREFFLRGRHNNCQVFYLSQSYFKIPKGLIRENANWLYLGQGLHARDVKMIAQNYASQIDSAEFMRFYKEATAIPHGFAIVDTTRAIDDGMFMKSFNEVFVPRMDDFV